MTSSAHERNKRSADDHVTMTAENMITSDDDDDDTAAVSRPMRLKRDLRDYLYNRRSINPGKTMPLCNLSDYDYVKSDLLEMLPCTRCALGLYV